MAYVEPSFPTKKALREAVKKGASVTVVQPGGLFPLDVPPSGWVTIEGPSYRMHTWYAVVEVTDDNRVKRVVS